MSARRPVLFALPLAILATLPACGDRRLTPIELPGGATNDAGVTACATATLVGFATVEGGTAGGQDGGPVLVSTAADLQAAIRRPEPLVIFVQGMLSSSGQVDVKSSKTIVGVGPSSGLLGFGLDLGDSHDIIIRNLVIAKATTDAISLNNTTHVWIDHCDLSSDLAHGKDYYDGLVDITHASDDVTISWTRFHDHYHPSLIGHDDANAAQDTGHLNVTYHHNLFEHTESYNPTIRFGKLHAFDNHYVDLLLNGISSRMGAVVRAEENTFDGVPTPLTTQFESPTDGFIEALGNVFIGAYTNVITQTSEWMPPYPYTVDPAAAAVEAVDRCAGTGHM
jgi:pectate lyase